MPESSAVPALPGLTVVAAEWLPSGAESGLVRVRGRWDREAAAEPDLPVLAMRAGGGEHRFESLPDARFSRDASSWRGTYLVPADLVATDPEVLWLEWPSGSRSGLPPLKRGVEPRPVPAAPERPEPPDEPGGQVIDRAVLAERRARRAEAAEQAQAKVAAEALKAVEVLELRSAELERRLEEAAAQRSAATDESREALSAALASAAALRARSRDWQLKLRTSEITRTGDAVRLAVLESERVRDTDTLRAALDRALAEAEEARGELAGLHTQLEAARTEARARAEEIEAAAARAAHAESAGAGAEARAKLESVARAALEDELDRERATTAKLRQELGLARSDAEDLRTALEAERESRRAADVAARAGEATLQERIADLERLAPASQPSPEADQVVADLDAAAAALRRRADVELVEDDESEPPAPDAEPAVEWSESAEESDREPCTPGVEPVRPDSEEREPIPWSPPGGPEPDDDGDEPPAPDAEPGIEWRRPQEPDAPAAAVIETVVQPVVPEPEPEPEHAPEPEPERPRPTIVPAAKAPSRAMAIGSDRRDYPLLRGAIVKLAHDDPATAARLLVALLPAQGAALEGPLAYDLTIQEAGTYGVAIAGGRAFVEELERPRPRSAAEFHLMGDAVMLAELLAGVDHRIGRFFGPVRARGRKRRTKELRGLSETTISLSDAARAGARLEPELVYRLLAYAVHPTWTRGFRFTIAQTFTGDAPKTWYLSVSDGAGLSVSDTGGEPDATVEMSRETFDRLLRGEPVPAGQRPCVRGDRLAVDHMRAWTQRAQSLG